MKVRELIEALRKANQDADVLITDGGSEYATLREIASGLYTHRDCTVCHPDDVLDGVYSNDELHPCVMVST